MYYLKHEKECFIGFKTRGAAERFKSDKTRLSSVLNGFQNDYNRVISMRVVIYFLYRLRLSCLANNRLWNYKLRLR